MKEITHQEAVALHNDGEQVWQRYSNNCIWSKTADPREKQYTGIVFGINPNFFKDYIMLDGKLLTPPSRRLKTVFDLFSFVSAALVILGIWKLFEISWSIFVWILNHVEIK